MRPKPRSTNWKAIIWACFLIKLALDCGIIFFGREWPIYKVYEETILFFWVIAGLCMAITLTKSNHRIKDGLFELTGHLVLGVLAVWTFVSFTYFLFGNHIPH